MALAELFAMRKAVKAQNEGNTEEAMRQYQACIDQGSQDMKCILSYVVLLLRKGEYEKSREILVKVQKYPMTEDQRRQLFINYAACVYRLGEIDKAIQLMERQHEKGESGLVYETLGYLYVEKGDFDKALSYNTQACEYDDEDSITLDNLGQTWYRLGNDKQKAKEYFDKAHELKPRQLDTLYFLALYDLEAGDKEAAKDKIETLLEGRYSPLNYASREKAEELQKQL